MSTIPTSIPQDLKTPWLNVARRMQSVARTGGLALISITVLVDAEGTPRFWVAPTCRKIEPRSSADAILAILTTSITALDGNNGDE
jgi:hypothetical protein